MANTNLYASAGSRRKTPQSESIPGRQMVKNAAGGYVFTLSPWDHLDRFLILGTDGGTYYASERSLTRNSLTAVEALIALDGPRVVARVVELSQAGRAYRNTPAIWAIAACQVLGDHATKVAAGAAMPRVIRTGAHLFQWASCMKELGTGWGRGVKKSISTWYLGKDVDALVYQMTKYRQRDGWTHRDILRLAHIFSDGLGFDKEGFLDHVRVCGWAAGKVEVLPDAQGDRLQAFAALQISDVAGAVDLIRRHSFTREMVPSELLRSPEVWTALLQEMPLTALLRSLGKLTSNGVVKPLSAGEALVVSKLTDAALLRRARVHPAGVLQALKVYKGGEGLKGSLSWSPSSAVLGALETAFDLSFASVEPSNARILLAIDASGSMTWASCVGLDALTALEGAAAMAMAVARREPRHHIVTFTTDVVAAKVSARSSLGEAMHAVNRNGGATDGSSPMRWAESAGIDVDAFVLVTDGETWKGDYHPAQALKRYREASGINAKMVVIGMSATGTTFADPSDAGSLDVVGFDANAPLIVSDFCRAQPVTERDQQTTDTED